MNCSPTTFSNLSISHVRTPEEGSCLRARKKAVTRNRIIVTAILDAQLPQLGEIHVVPQTP